MKINTGCFLNGCKCFDPNDEDGVGIKPDKEWQGLTAAEMIDIVNGAIGLMDAIYDAQAKLKEKNT